MAIPQLESSIERSMYIWIRTDWLEKLGLKPPKTMADVLAISKAFTGTIRTGMECRIRTDLALRRIYGGAMGLEGFMAGYNAYPNI